uniref:Uncharacterized protein n=1 Tax=Cannabis sativa TaxID=3483 RepID=A0A803PKC4_CANSA
MGRHSRVCQYMENHLDEEQLVAPEQDLPLSAIGDREANINRAQADEEHQQRVPIGVPNALKDVKTVIRGPCLGGEARRKRDRYALGARPLLIQLKTIISMYHLTMKFPTPKGVATLKRDQDEARE